MTRTKPRSTVRKNRLKQANKNHESLISTYQEYFISDEDLAKTALNHLLHLNRRHRLKMPKKIKETYCKSCNEIFNKSNKFTVRINAGRLIKRCNNCGWVSKQNLSATNGR